MIAHVGWGDLNFNKSAPKNKRNLVVHKATSPPSRFPTGSPPLFLFSGRKISTLSSPLLPSSVQPQRSTLPSRFRSSSLKSRACASRATCSRCWNRQPSLSSTQKIDIIHRRSTPAYDTDARPYFMNNLRIYRTALAGVIMCRVRCAGAMQTFLLNPPRRPAGSPLDQRRSPARRSRDSHRSRLSRPRCCAEQSRAERNRAERSRAERSRVEQRWSWTRTPRGRPDRHPSERGRLELWTPADVDAAWTWTSADADAART